MQTTTNKIRMKTVNKRDTMTFVENPKREKPQTEEADKQFTIVLQCYKVLGKRKNTMS